MKDLYNKTLRTQGNKLKKTLENWKIPHTYKLINWYSKMSSESEHYHQKFNCDAAFHTEAQSILKFQRKTKIAVNLAMSDHKLYIIIETKTIHYNITFQRTVERNIQSGVSGVPWFGKGNGHLALGHGPQK